MLKQSNSSITIFSDGGARGNPGPAAASFVAFSGNKIIHRDSKFLGEATNNVAEYSAVILALEWLGKNFINAKVTYCLDSELVVKQLIGIYKIRDKRLMDFVMRIKELQNKSKLAIEWVHVKREKNALADKLVNENLDSNSRL